MSEGYARRTFLGGVAGLGLASALRADAVPATRHQVFVGTYSFGPDEVKTGNFGPDDAYSEGIYSFPFDPRTGRAGEVRLAARTPNPANLIVHPSRRLIYAGSSRLPIEQGQHRMTAFAIEGGLLREINHGPSGGGIPTQGAVDRSGRNLITANFDSDNVVCLRLARDGAVGALSSFVGRAPGVLPAKENPPTRKGAIAGGTRQDGPTDRTRPHMALLSADDRFVIATQMSTDSCTILTFDPASGALTPHGEAHNAHGSGPRHIAFGRDHRFLYSADEEGSTITGWAWDARRGALAALQQCTTLPRDVAIANKPAHVAVHPDGRFIYVNNRGHGSLAGFAIDPRSGRLTPIGWTMLGASVAWHFTFDPSGRWLLVANQSDSSTHIFAANGRTGALTPTGQIVRTPLPTCLQIV